MIRKDRERAWNWANGAGFSDEGPMASGRTGSTCTRITTPLYSGALAVAGRALLNGRRSSQIATGPTSLAGTDEEAAPARAAPAEVLPMFFERLTAWTLVIVYYTITCGAIVLGLRGAL
jgi:hypothetical protein